MLFRSQKAGLTSRVIDNDAAHAKAQILAAGPCVVVVGHSNTVPELIGELGGPSTVAIEEDEFDRLFVLNVAPSATASLLQMRYVVA